MRLLKKYLILSHRYLGIGLGLLVIMWFVTGIVMMYAGGLPRLTPQLRLERLSDLDLARVQLSAADAAERVRELTGDESAGRGRAQLLTVLERPAYRVAGETVFADTGEVMEEASLEQSRASAARFIRQPESRVTHVATITRIDQWTIAQSRAMPLHKFRVDDAAGTELYVQPRTGEVVTMTTRRERALAWAGVIPHWFYFTALREHQPLWYRLVVWTSAAACVLAAIGLILSVVLFRRTKPFRLAKAIPYAGPMRWHYITGAVFGVFTLTWAFSGLLSMEPFAWTNATGLQVPREAMTGGAVDLASFARIDPHSWEHVLGGRAVKEVEFNRIQDEHYYVVRLASNDPVVIPRGERLHQPYNISGRVERDRLFVNARTLAVRTEPFSEASMLGRLQAAFPGVPVVQSALLTEYDSYYYSRGRQTPLPVFRVKFADPAETWVYVDPDTSQVLASIHRLNRVERWFYNGLHSLDFAFWYNRRPLWDIGMLTLLIGGLTTTCLGLFMGVKRLRIRPARVPQGAGPVIPDAPARGAVPAALTDSSQSHA